MGEPGFPSQFIWRGETIEIEQVVRSWRDTGPCRNGSDEQYVRKHWYEVVTSSGARMTIYFDRQARTGGTREMPLVAVFSRQIAMTVILVQSPAFRRSCLCVFVMSFILFRYLRWIKRSPITCGTAALGCESSIVG